MLYLSHCTLWQHSEISSPHLIPGDQIPMFRGSVLPIFSLKSSHSGQFDCFCYHWGTNQLALLRGAGATGYVEFWEKAKCNCSYQPKEVEVEAATIQLLLKQLPCMLEFMKRDTVRQELTQTLFAICFLTVRYHSIFHRGPLFFLFTRTKWVQRSKLKEPLASRTGHIKLHVGKSGKSPFSDVWQ